MDYKLLDRKIDEILSTFSKEELDNWFSFDSERVMFEQITTGQTITTSHRINVIRLKDSNEIFPTESSNHYALAA